MQEMADNIPLTIIRNIPPFVRLPAGNNGSSFNLPTGVLEYNTEYLAQEDDQSTINPTLSSPIEQENADLILIGGLLNIN